jgi:hypothetical protein
LLFGLALRAGESSVDGRSGPQFAEKKLVVHIAHQEGVASYSWSPADVSSVQARDYLAALAAEFLDPAGFDLLPIDILMGTKGLHRAFLQDGDGELSERDSQLYRADFQDAVDNDSEKSPPLYRPMKLLSIVPAGVPADAFEKVRRRFRLLNSGIARAREEISA